MWDTILGHCDEACLRVIEVAGVWLGAIATFAAVVVSLSLAHRSRPKLQIRVGLRTVVQEGNPEYRQEIVSFSVVNHSERAVVVEGVAWRQWRFSRAHAYQKFNWADSPTVPCKLGSGERQTFWFPRVHEGEEWTGDAFREFLRPYPPLMARLLKVYVYTPTGEVFYGKVEADLRRHLVEHSRK